MLRAESNRSMHRFSSPPLLQTDLGGFLVFVGDFDVSTASSFDCSVQPHAAGPLAVYCIQKFPR